MKSLTQYPQSPACAERWHGKVEALEDALLATVLEQEAAHGGLVPMQVLQALADLAALVVLAQPAQARPALLERLRALLHEQVINESVHEGAAVGRRGVN